MVNRFGSYFYGSILGVFLLAVLTPRASARGAFYGLMIGMAAVFAVSRYTAVHFLWYNVVGAVTVFASGLLITALSPDRAPAALFGLVAHLGQLRSLTVFADAAHHDVLAVPANAAHGHVSEEAGHLRGKESRRPPEVAIDDQRAAG